MNVLIKKEIRLLLPAWIAAMLLAIVSGWIISAWSDQPANAPSIYAASGLASTLGFLFLGISSFGQEFGFGTFSFLLSQPVSRQRIWLVKTTVLAIAFISILMGLAVSWELHKFYFSGHVAHAPFLFNFESLLYAFVFLSGGLWTTLLLRQVTGAFWFTLILPVTLVFLVSVLLDNFSTNGTRYSATCIMSVLLLYSIAGFFWARSMFLRAQDALWTGGEISFPWRRKISTQTVVSFSSQPRHWLSALVRKEFQLHQVTILIAAFVLVLHLASVFIRKIHPSFENPNVKFILEEVWALWLLMPLLIERTKDINSGIFVPVIAIFFISFYASTLARTTIQAIGITIGFSAALYFYELMTVTGIRISGLLFSNEGGQVRLELLKDYLSCLVLLLVLARLSFGNFKWLHENWKLWRRNLIAVVASLAFSFVLANGIYFHAWEFLMATDRPYGAARLNVSESPKLLTSYNAISALLPDGRLWTEQTDFYGANAGRIVPRLNTQHFVDGSSWTDAASDSFRVVAIQADGSLWSFQTYGGWRGMPTYPLTQIGSDRDWLHVTGGGNGFLLLKNEGTLWMWGVDNSSLSSDKLKKYLAIPPKCLDEGTDWTGFFSYNHNSGPFARKNDGSIWFRERETNSMFHLRQLESWQFPNEGFVSFASIGEWTVGIKTNGELWLILYQENQKPKKIQLGQNAKWKAAVVVAEHSLIALRSDGTLWKWSSLWNLVQNPVSAKPAQLGNHSDWIALSSISYWNSVALAADGSLWIWDDPSVHVWLAPSRKPVFIGNIFQETDSKAE